MIALLAPVDVLMLMAPSLNTHSLKGNSAISENAAATHHISLTFKSWFSESVVVPLPKEASDPLSTLSMLPSREPPSSKSLELRYLESHEKHKINSYANNAHE